MNPEGHFGGNGSPFASFDNRQDEARNAVEAARAPAPRHAGRRRAVPEFPRPGDREASVSLLRSGEESENRGANPLRRFEGLAGLLLVGFGGSIRIPRRHGVKGQTLAVLSQEFAERRPHFDALGEKSHEVVGSLRETARVYEQRLQELLRRLLRVEADHVPRDFLRRQDAPYRKEVVFGLRRPGVLSCSQARS